MRTTNIVFFNRHAYNVPISEVNMLIVRALLDLPAQLDAPAAPTSLASQIKSMLTRFWGVVKNYIRSPDSQLECLKATEYYTLMAQKSQHSANFTPATLTALISFLYDKDVLEEEVIMRWHRSPQPLSALLLDDVEVKSEEQAALRNHAAITKFIEWLQEAEEESDD